MLQSNHFLGGKGLHQGMSIIDHLSLAPIARMANHSNKALKKIRSRGRELAARMKEGLLALGQVLNEIYQGVKLRLFSQLRPFRSFGAFKKC